MLAWAKAVWLQARHAPRARHACLCGHARSPCLLHTDIVPCLWQLLALCPKGWWSNLVRTFSAATGGAKGTAVAAAGARAAATPTGPPQVLVLVAFGLLSALAPRMGGGKGKGHLRAAAARRHYITSAGPWDMGADV